MIIIKSLNQFKEVLSYHSINQGFKIHFNKQKIHQINMKICYNNSENNGSSTNKI
jgi:hypothetical protein